MSVFDNTETATKIKTEPNAVSEKRRSSKSTKSSEKRKESLRTGAIDDKKAATSKRQSASSKDSFESEKDRKPKTQPDAVLEKREEWKITLDNKESRPSLAVDDEALRNDQLGVVIESTNETPIPRGRQNASGKKSPDSGSKSSSPMSTDSKGARGSLSDPKRVSYGTAGEPSSAIKSMMHRRYTMPEVEYIRAGSEQDRKPKTLPDAVLEKRGEWKITSERKESHPSLAVDNEALRNDKLDVAVESKDEQFSTSKPASAKRSSDSGSKPKLPLPSLGSRGEIKPAAKTFDIADATAKDPSLKVRAEGPKKSTLSGKGSEQERFIPGSGPSGSRVRFDVAPSEPERAASAIYDYPYQRSEAHAVTKSSSNPSFGLRAKDYQVECPVSHRLESVSIVPGIGTREPEISRVRVEMIPKLTSKARVEPTVVGEIKLADKWFECQCAGVCKCPADTPLQMHTRVASVRDCALICVACGGETPAVSTFTAAFCAQCNGNLCPRCISNHHYNLLTHNMHDIFGNPILFCKIHPPGNPREGGLLQKRHCLKCHSRMHQHKSAEFQRPVVPTKHRVLLVHSLRKSDASKDKLSFSEASVSCVVCGTETHKSPFSCVFCEECGGNLCPVCVSFHYGYLSLSHNLLNAYDEPISLCPNHAELINKAGTAPGNMGYKCVICHAMSLALQTPVTRLQFTALRALLGKTKRKELKQKWRQQDEHRVRHLAKKERETEGGAYARPQPVIGDRAIPLRPAISRKASVKKKGLTHKVAWTKNAATLKMTNPKGGGIVFKEIPKSEIRKAAQQAGVSDQRLNRLIPPNKATSGPYNRNPQWNSGTDEELSTSDLRTPAVIPIKGRPPIVSPSKMATGGTKRAGTFSCRQVHDEKNAEKPNPVKSRRIKATTARLSPNWLGKMTEEDKESKLRNTTPLSPERQIAREKMVTRGSTDTHSFDGTSGPNTGLYTERPRSSVRHTHFPTKMANGNFTARLANTQILFPHYF